MSMNCFLMLDSDLVCCPDELTSPPCCLSCSCSKELADASVLGGPIPMDGLIGTSSSEKGSESLCFLPLLICWGSERSFFLSISLPGSFFISWSLQHRGLNCYLLFWKDLFLGLLLYTCRCISHLFLLFCTREWLLSLYFLSFICSSSLSSGLGRLLGSSRRGSSYSKVLRSWRKNLCKIFQVSCFFKILCCFLCYFFLRACLH